MSLVLRVPQRAVPIRRAPLRSRVELLRAVLGVRDFDLGLLCVDNEGMQRLNRAYRGDDRPTDVLSFPFHEVSASRSGPASGRQPLHFSLRFFTYFKSSLHPAWARTPNPSSRAPPGPWSRRPCFQNPKYDSVPGTKYVRVKLLPNTGFFP